MTPVGQPQGEEIGVLRPFSFSAASRGSLCTVRVDYGGVANCPQLAGARMQGCGANTCRGGRAWLLVHPPPPPPLPPSAMLQHPLFKSWKQRRGDAYLHNYSQSTLHLAFMSDKDQAGPACHEASGSARVKLVILWLSPGGSVSAAGRSAADALPL